MKTSRVLLGAGLLAATVCAWLNGAVAQTPGKVIEGAIVRYDRAARTASVAPCQECKPLLLRVTERTELRTASGERRPFRADTEIGGLVDTMYDPSDNTVIWFRPLPLGRK